MTLLEPFPVQRDVFRLVFSQELVQVQLEPAIKARSAATSKGLLQLVHLNHSVLRGEVCVHLHLAFEDLFKVFHGVVKIAGNGNGDEDPKGDHDEGEKLKEGTGNRGGLCLVVRVLHLHHLQQEEDAKGGKNEAEHSGNDHFRSVPFIAFLFFITLGFCLP